MSYTGLVERNRALADEIEARHIRGMVSASDDVADRIVAGLREAADAIEALTRPVDVEAVITEALIGVRAANAGNFGNTGLRWQGYDEAVLDCIAAVKAALAAMEAPHADG